MTDKQFWQLIDESRQIVPYDYAVQHARLKELLITRYSSHDILLFNYFHQIYRINLHRWDLFEALRIMTGKWDEDDFLSFRELLVAQGQHFYHELLADPDSTLCKFPIEYLDFLSFNADLSYVGIKVYLEMTGDQSILNGIHLLDQPNDEWADLAFDPSKSLSKLIAKFPKPVGS